MKKSVFVNEATADAIKKRFKPGEENFSGAINNLFCARYRVMVRESLNVIDLTTEEWVALFGIYNGTMTTHDPSGVAKMLLAEVLESDTYLAGGAQDLPGKIQGMNLCRRLAVIDIIDRFWAGSWDEYSGYKEIIDELKQSV